MSFEVFVSNTLHDARMSDAMSSHILNVPLMMVVT